MTLKEAIEILRDIEPAKLSYFLGNEKQALKLGIEALKRLEKLREDNAPRANFILLGETKDD